MNFWRNTASSMKWTQHAIYWDHDSLTAWQLDGHESKQWKIQPWMLFLQSYWRAAGWKGGALQLGMRWGQKMWSMGWNVTCMYEVGNICTESWVKTALRQQKVQWWILCPNACNKLALLHDYWRAAGWGVGRDTAWGGDRKCGACCNMHVSSIRHSLSFFLSFLLSMLLTHRPCLLHEWLTLKYLNVAVRHLHQSTYMYSVCIPYMTLTTWCNDWVMLPPFPGIPECCPTRTLTCWYFSYSPHSSSWLIKAFPQSSSRKITDSSVCQLWRYWIPFSTPYSRVMRCRSW